MAYVRFDCFEGDKRRGIQKPNRILVNGGEDGNFAVNANQIDWGISYFLNKFNDNKPLSYCTTEEVLTRIEDAIDDVTITYNNVWEIISNEEQQTP